MPDYLTRPIFTWRANLRELPAASWSYDLKRIKIGQAKARFERTQTHPVRSWSGSVTLNGRQEIIDYDSFLSSAKGMLNGFWLPEPDQFCSPIERTSSTHFTIQDQNLRDYWSEYPELHLMILAPFGDTPIYCKIESVGAWTGGTERIEISGATVPAEIDSNWTVARLLYCRFSEARQDSEMLSEGVQERSVSILELPMEYASIETGQEPIYLYEFEVDTCGQVSKWRLTSYDVDIVSNGETFSSFPITHQQITRGLRERIGSVTVQSWFDLSLNPLSRFIPSNPGGRLKLTIMEAQASAPDGVEIVFSGFVRRVRARGALLSATCSVLTNLLDRKIPGITIGPRCSHRLYDMSTCKVVRAIWEKTCVIDSLQGNVVTVSDASLAGTEAGAFRHGVLESGTGSSCELAGVLDNAAAVGNEVALTLTRPLSFASVSDPAKVAPGCNRTYERCQDYSNTDNFSGHLNVPAQNPSIATPKVKNDSGNKK